MAFSISEFSSQINKHGLAKNSLFLVRLIVPPALAGEVDNTMGRELQFFCRSVTLPELSIQTFDTLPNGFGTPERRPTGMQFPQVPAVFMVDSNFSVMKFFHSWMQRIVNYDTRQPFGQVNGRLPFEIAYKSEYAASMIIDVYSYEQEDIVYTYRMENVYPTSVGEVVEAWENAAEIMTLPITFTYDRMILSGAKQGSVVSNNSRGSGILGNLSSLNTFGQAINQLRRPRGIQDAINQFTNAQTIFNNIF